MNEHSPRIVPDVTRRRFLQGSALAGFSAFLAACGTEWNGQHPRPRAPPRVRRRHRARRRRRRPPRAAVARRPS